MTVFVVIRHCYESDDIDGVYSSELNAYASFRGKPGIDLYEVKEWEVDGDPIEN